MPIRTSWLAPCLFVLCLAGEASSQVRVTPPPPRVELSAEEQVMLDGLRKSGEAVFSVGSVACVRELDRIKSERMSSNRRTPDPDADSMKARYETDMFFANERMTVIEKHCGKADNRGDYNHSGVVSVTFLM